MRALVLSGGAVKGAYQIGVLKKWMGEEAIDYDIMCGVSVGALNVAGLAQTALGDPRRAIERVEEFWRTKLRTTSVYQRWKPFGRLHALQKTSVYDSTPLAKLVETTLSAELIQQSGRKLAVGACCMETGEFHYGREDDPQFLRWVLASSCYPIFLQPIEIDGKLWCDGGLRHMTPLRQAIRMGAKEVDVIMCSNPSLPSPWNSKSRVAVPDQIIRAFDLMQDQILRADLQLVGLANDVVVRADPHRHVKIRVVQPRVRLTAGTLEFDPDEIDEMIAIGYADADTYVVYE